MHARLFTVAFATLSLFSLASANCGNGGKSANRVKTSLSKSHSHSHKHGSHSHTHHHHVAKKNHSHHTSHRAAKAAKKHRNSGSKKVDVKTPAAFAAVASSKKQPAAAPAPAASSGGGSDDDGSGDDGGDDSGDDDSGDDGSSSGSDSGSDSSSSSGGSIGSSSSSTSSGSSSSSSAAMSLLSRVSSSCGSSDPTKSSSQSGGPNGLQSWSGCGIEGNGWAPPKVTMEMLTVKDLESTGSLFDACKPFFSIFEKYGKQFNIPAIFLASFAMQESSCNPNTSGDNGGAFGLMQITSDKCGGAPGGKCNDPDYNVMMGAKTFADGLSQSGGNVLVALGAYNGWYVGMTKNAAIQAKYQGCCECQQNLDYLQQFLNGWLQGVDPYSQKLGTIGNLDSCEG